jgi:hypothetical protein
MRSTCFSLALAVAALAFVSVPGARAQYVSVYYGPGYGYGTYYDPGYYYPPTYYTPGVYPYGTYAVPSYYWSANVYYAPRVRGWSYGTYYPYANQYLYSYGYRTYPGRWRR